MWLTKLKAALVEKNTDAINMLLDDIPTLNTEDEVQQALHLLSEASKLVETLKDETVLSMTQIKKNISFLHSTKENAKSSLDIIS